MTKPVQQNINIIVPLLAASYLGYKTYNKSKDTKQTAIVAGLTLLIVYAITSSITGGIKRASDTAINESIPPDPTYNPAPVASSLFQDIYEIFGFRNKEIYKELAALKDSHFIQVAKYWNDNFYYKSKETLKQAINGEVLGIELEGTLNTINQRFTNLKIN